MRAYFCDRCGARKDRCESVDIKNGARLVSDVRWISLCSGTGYKRDLDLCKDCLESFKSWFGNEEPEEMPSDD